MSILKTIVTTTVQIVDGDNRPGNGSLTIRPNAPFEYFDGASTIQVSNAAVTIPVVGGKLGATLQLQPNTGASNVPETWYIVDVDINEVPFQLFWQIDSADAATIEFTDVTQLPTSANINQGLVAHVRAANPHGQYGLRSDMVSVGTIGAASDGLGYIPRVDPVTGKLDSSLYSGGTGGITASDVPIVDSGGYYTATEVEGALQEAALYFPTGTRMIFQQDTAPTGWTKETGAAYGDAMAVVSVGSFTVGVSDTGGSSDAKTHNHTITHTHSYSNIAHTHYSVGSGWDASKKAGTGAFILVPSDGYSESGAIATDSSPSNTGAASAANSGTFTPKYYLQIIAAKD